MCYVNSQGDSCIPCQEGTYSPAAGNGTCTVCVDHSSSTSGSASPSDCLCDKGFTGDGNSSCVACVPGKYKDIEGSQPCSNCSQNTYSQTVAASSTSVCIPCGQFQSSPSGSASAADCDCNQNFERSVASNDCICKDGHSLSGTICVPCVEDTYCKDGQLSSCPSNSASLAGSSAATSCECNAGYTGPNGEICTVCAAGKYKGASGNESCTACPMGTYSPTEGATEESFCLPCTPDSDSSIGSTEATDCKCNAGHSGNDGGPCLVCGAGLYKEGTGSGACTACSKGKSLKVPCSSLDRVGI